MMAIDPICKKCKWNGTKAQVETAICLTCDSRDKYGNFKNKKNNEN